MLFIILSTYYCCWIRCYFFKVQVL